MERNKHMVNLATMSERSQRSLPGYLDFDLEIGPGSGREYPRGGDDSVNPADSLSYSRPTYLRGV